MSLRRHGSTSHVSDGILRSVTSVISTERITKGEQGDTRPKWRQ